MKMRFANKKHIHTYLFMSQTGFNHKMALQLNLNEIFIKCSCIQRCKSAPSLIVKQNVIGYTVTRTCYDLSVKCSVNGRWSPQTCGFVSTSCHQKCFKIHKFKFHIGHLKMHRRQGCTDELKCHLNPLLQINYPPATHPHLYFRLDPHPIVTLQ